MIAEVAVVGTFARVCAHVLLQSFLASECLITTHLFAAELAAHCLLGIVLRRVIDLVLSRVRCLLHFYYTISRTI